MPAQPVYLACPNCGFQWRQFRDTGKQSFEVLYCPAEDGGCDKPLAVQFSPRIDVVIFEVGDEPFIPQESE